MCTFFFDGRVFGYGGLKLSVLWSWLEGDGVCCCCS